MQAIQESVESHAARQAQRPSPIHLAGPTEQELRSTIDEMNTLNNQPARANAQLEEINTELLSQLQILRDSVTLVSLDKAMRIVLATPSAVRFFTVAPGDAGRPITDFIQKFDDPRFIDAIRTAMRTREPAEHQVSSADHQRWLVQLRPADAGITLIFTNITPEGSRGEPQGEALDASTELFRKRPIATA